MPRRVAYVSLNPSSFAGRTTVARLVLYPTDDARQPGPGGGCPDDEGKRHPAVLDRLAGKRAQQHLGAQGATVLQRLRDRGEPGVTRGLHVVEPDDRELLGHRDAGLLRRVEHSDRLDV